MTYIYISNSSQFFLSFSNFIAYFETGNVLPQKRGCVALTRHKRSTSKIAIANLADRIFSRQSRNEFCGWPPERMPIVWLHGRTRYFDQSDFNCRLNFSIFLCRLNFSNVVLNPLSANIISYSKMLLTTYLFDHKSRQRLHTVIVSYEGAEF